MSRDDGLDAVVDRVSVLLQRRVGIRTEPTARDRLRRGIRAEAADQGLDFGRYLDAVTAGGPVLQRLLNRITVQETRFFRHPEHFEALVRDVLPGLVPPVRVWSAGCANGQEAFSLAMVLDEQAIPGSVIATDLSTDALRRTTNAHYTARETLGLSPARMARHLTRAGDGWSINQPLRDRVTTLRHNLVDSVPDLVRNCQLVFCRNVLIYVSKEYARAFLQRLADEVGPAALFLGSAETIWSISDRFQTVRAGSTYFYRPSPGTKVLPAGVQPSRSEPGAAPAAAAPARRAAAVGTAVGPTLRRAGPPEPVDPSGAAALLAAAGKQALAAGDHQAAVVSFRKWAYLAPADALAYLHLGLALEAGGDQSSAWRAFEAARWAVTVADPEHVLWGMEGYATVELLRLLDVKQEATGS